MICFSSLGSWASSDDAQIVNLVMFWKRISCMTCTICGIIPNLFSLCLCDRVICFFSIMGFYFNEDENEVKNCNERENEESPMF